MNFFLLLAIAASLVCKALCQFSWDPGLLVFFAADNAFATVVELKSCHRESLMGMKAFELRGNDGMCALMSSDFGTGRQMLDTRNPPSAKSRWQRSNRNNWKSAMKTWYWHEVNSLPQSCKFQGPWAQAIAAIAPSGLSWTCLRFIHQDPKSPLPISQQGYWPHTKGVQKYQRVATGASINIALLHSQTGFIIFQPGNSAKFAAARNWGRSDDIPGGELPLLLAPADFMWAEWERLHPNWKSQEIRNIKYCGVQQVNDGPALKLIARYLLQKSIWDLEDWPARGSTWSTSTPEGRGLLGTTAAAQCAGFLWQHKEDLGIKYIVSVKVFRGAPFPTPKGPQRLPQLLFEIADVPQGQIKPDPPPGWIPPAPRPIPWLAPQPTPVVPGPSTPRPVAPRPPPPPDEEDPDWGTGSLQKRTSKVTYEFKQEGSGKNFVCSHIFGLG